MSEDSTLVGEISEKKATHGVQTIGCGLSVDAGPKGRPRASRRAGTRRFLDAQFAGPTRLTGGSLGPEGSVVCVAVIAGLCCLCAASLGRHYKAANNEGARTTMRVSKAS
jgi:hypothetical protein